MTTKGDLRKAALRSRRELLNRDALSRRILDRLFASEIYRASRQLLIYVSVRTEVVTRPHIAQALADGKTVYVPYCVGEALRLFQLQNIDELQRGAFGIPEPPESARTSERVGDIRRIELAIVPGVAFGRDGSRLGNGKGFYDRLFAEQPAPGARALRCGVAFECQMFDSLPVQAHDAKMDAVVTELSVYGPQREMLATL